MRSAHELRAHLQASRVPERAGASIVAACARQGLVDDRACAKLWATRLADRGYAWAAVREQLLEKGLEPRLVAQVLAPLAAREPDASRARLLLERERDRGRASRRRLPRHSTEWRGLRARWARLLARRGFEPDLIAQVLADFSEPTSTD
ncbi:MAG: RecX family transcriptional regulator [Candidatus Omnitrophica bacterium]|nr:RecX family transcriptional regulator [Candidatus Omnitrophota bacterium]